MSRQSVIGHLAIETQHLCPASLSRGGLSGLAGVPLGICPAMCLRRGVPPALERQFHLLTEKPFQKNRAGRPPGQAPQVRRRPLDDALSRTKDTFTTPPERNVSEKSISISDLKFGISVTTGLLHRTHAVCSDATVAKVGYNSGRYRCFSALYERHPHAARTAC